MKKYITLIILIALLSTSLLGVSTLAYAAVGDNIVENFDDTYVLNDLADATVWNKPFNVSDYPKDDNGELRLLEFAEYAFSTKYELQNKYGLYLYIYNPQCIAFADSELNKVQIATEYNADGDATKYEKFNISICSATTDKLFYKLKVEGISSIYDRVAKTPGERQYDISGVELLTPGAINAHDYKVGGTWIYKGYAKGCHASSEEESTLDSDIVSLTTIELDDLQFTYYRTWNTTNGDTSIADQLTSVYFSVPEDIARDYDRLYSIQAETYQYLTSPIVCLYKKFILGTNHLGVDYEKLYTDLLKQRGIATPYLHDASMDQILCWDVIDTGDKARTGALTGYNYTDSPMKGFVPFTTLAWLFQVDEKEDFSVTSETLLRYMQDYSKEFTSYNQVNGKYNAGLFADKYYSFVLDYKKVQNGKKELNIDISGDYDFTLVGSSTKYDFWKALFGKWDGTATSEPISPIIEVSYNDLWGLGDDEISSKYYVAKGDAAKFKEYLRTNQNRRVYLFRFDLSDYFVTNVCDAYGIVGYLAQEMAYLDFDIISMGYEQKGVITTIPVVCSPIDIIGGVESGRDSQNNGGLNLLAVILAIVIIGLIIWAASKLLGTIKKTR